jgi:glutamine synthetase
MEVLQACAAQNIPANTTISEYGPGQWEINIIHTKVGKFIA